MSLKPRGYCQLTTDIIGNNSGEAPVASFSFFGFLIELNQKIRKRIDLEKEMIKKSIYQLRQKLDNHNYRYYALNEPVIPDAEYDGGLMRELQELKEQYPQFAASNFPTQRVVAKPLEELSVMAHSVAMPSHENIKSTEEIIEANCWILCYSLIRSAISHEDVN